MFLLQLYYSLEVNSLWFYDEIAGLAHLETEKSVNYHFKQPWSTHSYSSGTRILDRRQQNKILSMFRSNNFQTNDTKLNLKACFTFWLVQNFYFIYISLSN